MAYTAIDDPEAYFQVALYTGNGGTQSITLPGDTDMQPDMVWSKARDAAENHSLSDTIQGDATSRDGLAVLHPNVNEASDNSAGNVYHSSFDSDGFSVGNNNQVNINTKLHVAWCWKESATAGFDLVGYTGTGSAKTEAHSLSAVPKLIIVKNLDAADAWQVYHAGNTAAPETDYLVLNTTATTADAADRWNDTAPTSSVFSLGDGDEVNTNTEDYVAYCFAEKQGFSKFGSYTGNADVDGPFLYTGFRPAFFMYKNTNDASNWFIFDNKRNPHNEVTTKLGANLNSAEDSGTTGNDVDFCANGVKIREDNGDLNGSGNIIVYMAFAEAPFVNSNGVPCNAR